MKKFLGQNYIKFPPRSKKGFEFLTNWVEVFFIVFALGGFIISAIIQNVALSYIIIFLSGLIFGTLIHHKKKDNVFPYVLLTVGFILGYAVGHRVGNMFVIIILFALGNGIALYIHEKRLMGKNI